MQVVLGLIIGSTSFSALATPSESAVEQVRRFCETAGLGWPESTESISVHPPKKATYMWYVGLKDIGSFGLNVEAGPVSSFSSNDFIKLRRNPPTRNERGETPAYSSETEAKRHLIELAHRLGIPRRWQISTFEVKPDTYDEFDKLIERGRYIIRFTQPSQHVVFDSWNVATVAIDYVTGKLTSFAYSYRITIVESQPVITRSQAITTATNAYEQPEKRGQSVVQSVDLGYYASRNERFNTERSMRVRAVLVWRVGFDHLKHVEPEYAYVSALTGDVIEVLRFR